MNLIKPLPPLISPEGIQNLHLITQNLKVIIDLTNTSKYGPIPEYSIQFIENALSNALISISKVKQEIIKS